MKVAFIPSGSLWKEGTGAHRSSNIIAKNLKKHPDVDLKIFSIKRDIKIGSKEKVAWLEDDIFEELQYGSGNMLSLSQYEFFRQLTLVKKRKELESFDIIHSYDMNLLPFLSILKTNTLLTLNSYSLLCPRNLYITRNGKLCKKKSNIDCFKCYTKEKKLFNKLYTRQHISNLNNTLAYIKKDDISGYHAISENIKRNYVKNGYDPKKIKMIYLPYDSKFYKCKKHKKMKGSPSLLAVGFLYREKGFQTAIRAVKYLVDKGSSPHLYIVGKGLFKNALEKLVKDLRLNEYVTFLGYIPNDKLYPYYSAADIFVYPGLVEEGFGRIFLEAMMAGTPVVSSNVGDAKNILRDAGVFFEKNNHKELARKIDNIYNKNKLDKMSNYAKERILDFEPQLIINKLVDFYEELISN